jgi:hypothetical protein
MENVRAAIREAIAAVKEAHQALKEAITVLRRLSVSAEVETTSQVEVE